MGAYDSEAIALFSAALSSALAEVDRSPLRFSPRAVKASFPVKITRQVIDAYDAGIRDLETLKKVGLSSVLPITSANSK